MDNITVQGKRIREARKALKLSQMELAEKVGVSATAITSWETERYSPEGINLVKLARALNVSTDYLLGKTDHPRNASPAFAVMPREFLEDTPGALDKISKITGISISDFEDYKSGKIEPGASRTHVIHNAMRTLGWRPKMAGDAHKNDGGAPVYDVPDSRGEILRIPILSPVKSACCGAGFPNSDEIYADMTNYLDMPSAIVGTISPDPELRPYFIYADGDSMINAGIIHGSMVLVNPAEPVYDGDSALVEYGIDGNIAIKRVYWLAEGAVKIASADDSGWSRTFSREEIQEQGLFRVKGKIMFAGIRPKRG